VTSQAKTETRHHPDGKTCHHFNYHRLTCDEYDALRARANGHCEICGRPEEDTPRGVLDVDHFEHWGVRFVRGLLCHKCNAGVMPCVDGRKVWGANRKWEAKAREYEANSWEKPSQRALELMAARTEKKPKYRPRPVPSRDRMYTINLPSRRGVPAMAATLRHWLTPDELAELSAILTQGASHEI
jgi:recombination endonuclease VII